MKRRDFLQLTEELREGYSDPDTFASEIMPEFIAAGLVTMWEDDDGEEMFGLTEKGSDLAQRHGYPDEREGIGEFIRFLVAGKVQREKLARRMRR